MLDTSNDSADTADRADGRLAAGGDPAKRHQILEGARRIFVTVGFDAASMNDITREAGVSKSTLYVYFRSKEELFQSLICQEQARYFAEIETIFTDPLNPAQTLQIYGLRLAELTTSTALVLAKRTVIAVASRMPELGRDFYRNGPQRGMERLAAYLRLADAAGSLRIEDAELAASQFIELTAAGILRRRLFDETAPRPTRQELEYTVTSAVRLFMAGYGT